MVLEWVPLWVPKHLLKGYLNIKKFPYHNYNFYESCSFRSFKSFGALGIDALISVCSPRNIWIPIHDVSSFGDLVAVCPSLRISWDPLMEGGFEPSRGGFLGVPGFLGFFCSCEKKHKRFIDLMSSFGLMKKHENKIEVRNNYVYRCLQYIDIYIYIYVCLYTYVIIYACSVSVLSTSSETYLISVNFWIASSSKISLKPRITTLLMIPSMTKLPTNRSDSIPAMQFVNNCVTSINNCSVVRKNTSFLAVCSFEK